MNPYLVAPMRSDFGVRRSCAGDTADSWDVLSRLGGYALVATCPTRADADAVAAGLWATEELQRLREESERVRHAACAALGVDHATLAEAVSALLAGHADALCRLEATARAWAWERGAGSALDETCIRDGDVAIAQAVLDEVRGVAP